MQRTNYLPLGALLIANVISYVGNIFAQLAIPWFVLETTGSALQTGITAFVGTVPLVIAGIFGGTIVDRLGYKHTSILADVMSGVAVGLIPLLFATVGLAFWQLLLLVFLGALLDVPGGSARESLIPELVTSTGLSLEQANSAFDLTRRLATLLGAPLAGVLLAAFGADLLLWLDAFSFALSALLIAVIIPAFPRNSPSVPRRYRDELWEGYQFIRQEHLLAALIMIFAAINLIGAPFYSVILPVYARSVYGSAVAMGIMTAGTAIGGVIGALLYGTIGQSLSKRWILVAVALFTALRYGLLALFPPLSVSIATLAVAGLFFGPLNPMTSTLIQARTPPLIRGRIFGFLEALTSASIPLGALVGGYLLEVWGLRSLLLIQATLSLVLGVNILWQNTFRRMDSSTGVKIETRI